MRYGINMDAKLHDNINGQLNERCTEEKLATAALPGLRAEEPREGRSSAIGHDLLIDELAIEIEVMYVRAAKGRSRPSIVVTPSRGEDWERVFLPHPQSEALASITDQYTVHLHKFVDWLDELPRQITVSGKTFRLRYLDRFPGPSGTMEGGGCGLNITS